MLQLLCHALEPGHEIFDVLMVSQPAAAVSRTAVSPAVRQSVPVGADTRKDHAKYNVRVASENLVMTLCRSTSRHKDQKSGNPSGECQILAGEDAGCYIAGPNDEPGDPGGDRFMLLYDWFGTPGDIGQAVRSSRGAGRRNDRDRGGPRGPADCGAGRPLLMADVRTVRMPAVGTRESDDRDVSCVAWAGLPAVRRYSGV